jgi:glutaminase
MNPFISFMASTAGRIVRAVAGAVLLYVGLQMMAGVGGIVVAVIGVVMIAAGVFDFCLFAPLFGNPLSGKQIRAGK